MSWLCCAWLQVLVMLCFPLFSYAGVVGTASGMVDLKDMKPLLNRLRPSSRELMVRRMKQMFSISCNFLVAFFCDAFKRKRLALFMWLHVFSLRVRNFHYMRI